MLPPVDRAPTISCASSRPTPSCRSPATRRSARAMPGSTLRAAAAARGRIVQECAAGLIPIGVTTRGSPSPRRRCALGARRGGVRAAHRARRPGSSAARSSRPSGSRTAPSGSRSCSPAPTTVLALAPGPMDFDLGVVGPHPDGAPRPSRCGLLPEGRGRGRGSGHREPQRIARAVAPRHRPRAGALRRAARARRSAARVGCTSRPMPRARCGSAAGRRPASPATSSSESGRGMSHRPPAP